MDPVLMLIAYAIGLSMVLGAAAGWAVVLILLVQETLAPALRELGLGRGSSARGPAPEL